MRPKTLTATVAPPFSTTFTATNLVKDNSSLSLNVTGTVTLTGSYGQFTDGKCGASYIQPTPYYSPLTCSNGGFCANNDTTYSNPLAYCVCQPGAGFSGTSCTTRVVEPQISALIAQPPLFGAQGYRNGARMWMVFDRPTDMGYVRRREEYPQCSSLSDIQLMSSPGVAVPPTAWLSAVSDTVSTEVVTKEKIDAGASFSVSPALNYSLRWINKTVAEITLLNVDTAAPNPVGTLRVRLDPATSIHDETSLSLSTPSVWSPVLSGSFGGMRRHQ